MTAQMSPTFGTNGTRNETPSYTPLKASDHANDQKFHLILAASGSVATIKIPNIINALSSLSNLSIRLILTASAAHFLRGQSLEQPDLTAIAALPNVDAIYFDENEWVVPWTRGAPILHIELRRWGDLLVIAPLSANTLAKIANGLCDNLLTSVVRAWEVEDPSFATPITSLDSTGVEALPERRQKMIFVAPAMNTAMWKHPLTAKHLDAGIQSVNYHWIVVLRPVEKELACGDTGVGAMVDWRVIAEKIKHTIAKHAIRGPLEK